jgi:hypothetical protein
MYICITGGAWLLLEAASGAGTVTSVSVVSANGFSGTVANPTTTPAITINNPTALVASTSITAPFFASAAADVADAGAVRLGNTEVVAWEKATPGTDWTLGVNASDILATNAPFQALTFNKVTITQPASGAILTIPDGVTLNAGAGGTLGSNAFTSTAYAPLASPTFTGTVTIPTPFTIGAVSMTATGTELNFVAGVTSAIQTQLNAKQSTVTFGTGVQTALGVNVGSAGAPVLFNGAGGTPSSLILTNATGLPAASVLAGSFGAGAFVISTSLQAATIELGAATDTTLSRVSAGVIAVEGVNVLASGATGVQTFLTTPSSANLRAALTDELGTGAALFDGATPTSFVGTNISGTAASLTAGTATNATNTAVTEDTTTNATVYPTWVTANTGNLPQKTTSTKLTFNPSTAVLATTGNMGIGTATPDLISSGFRTLTIQSSSARAKLEMSNTATSTAGVAGQIDFLNGSTQLAAIQSVADGATNSGYLAFFTNSAGGGLTPQMYIRATGVLNFNTANYNTGSLTVVAGVMTASSDERLKNIQGPFTRGLDAILALNPILYTWKPESGINSPLTFAGLGAQNVIKSIPEAVSLNGNGFYTLSDRPIISALITSIKELNARIVTLEQGKQ